MLRRFVRTCAVCVLCALPALAGCSKGKSADEAKAKEMPPPHVSVITVKGRDLPIVNNLPGRIAPTRIAEVRPRVSGIITKRVFEQGSHVKQGDLLYQIDPAPFQVQVDSAKADVEKAKAAQLQAKQQYERLKALRKNKVASQKDYEDAVSALAEANANVDAAKANLKSAELNLQYSHVTAPISGRIGAAEITEGALVTANSTQNLATIQQLDPVYADFTQSADELMRLRKEMKDAGKLDEKTSVKLRFDNGHAYDHTGKLLFSEASVDSNTGQITLRAEFPNPEGNLLPGMYVRVLIQQGVQQNALTVPQQAVQRDVQGDAELDVVQADDTIAVKKVDLGRIVGERWVVTSGLKPGEKVVVEGFQKIQPGAKVVADAWRGGIDDKANTQKEASLASPASASHE